MLGQLNYACICDLATINKVQTLQRSAVDSNRHDSMVSDVTTTANVNGMQSCPTLHKCLCLNWIKTICIFTV